MYETEFSEISDLLSLVDSANIFVNSFESNRVDKKSKAAAFISEFKKYQNKYELNKKKYERQKTIYPISISQQELEEYENK